MKPRLLLETVSELIWSHYVYLFEEIRATFSLWNLWMGMFATNMLFGVVCSVGLVVFVVN